jgi:hypothetical protein
MAGDACMSSCGSERKRRGPADAGDGMEDQRREACVQHASQVQQ